MKCELCGDHIESQPNEVLPVCDECLKVATS